MLLAEEKAEDSTAVILAILEHTRHFHGRPPRLGIQQDILAVAIPKAHEVSQHAPEGLVSSREQLKLSGSNCGCPWPS